MMLILERNFEQGPHDILHLPSLPADGVIMASATQSSPVVEELLARGIPTVLMQRDVPGLDVDRVDTQHRA
jgi:LacI family transcriptional regulator